MTLASSGFGCRSGMNDVTTPAKSSNSEDRSRTNRRAYHSKSRSGCCTCKQRRVRCDERQPLCSPCERLQLTCVFVPVQPPTKPQNRYQRILKDLLPASIGPTTTNAALSAQHNKQPQQSSKIILTATKYDKPYSSVHSIPQHIWATEATARNVVYDAFATLDPIGNTRANPFSEIIPRESYTNDSYKFICLALYDLSHSRDIAVRRNCFVRMGTASAKHSDRHVVSAIRNYTHALAAFRAALGSGMSPRDIAIGTFCFAIFELMQGHFAARHAIMTAGIALLRPCVSMTTRADGSVGYGMHLRYEEERMVLYIEGLIVRSAATSFLRGDGCAGGKNEIRQVVTTVERHGVKAHNTLLPEFILPAVFPIPLESDSKAELRRKWIVFHRTLESWHLSRYWLVAIGVRLNARRHLAEQQCLWEHLRLWLTTIQHITSPSAVTAHQVNARIKDTYDHDSTAMLDMLVTYIKCLLLAMASTAQGDESPDLYARVEDPDPARLSALLSHPTNYIDGFHTSPTNILFFDSAILPLITTQALKAVKLSSVDGDGSSLHPPLSTSSTPLPTTPILAAARPTPMPRTTRSNIVEKQLALLQMQLSVVQNGFKDRELAISQGKVLDFHFMPLGARKHFSLASLPGPAMMAERALRGSSNQDICHEGTND